MKIIKPGVIKEPASKCRTCGVCGCVFEYDRADLIGGCMVRCPTCGDAIEVGIGRHEEQPWRRKDYPRWEAEMLGGQA